MPHHYPPTALGHGRMESHQRMAGQFSPGCFDGPWITRLTGDLTLA